MVVLGGQLPGHGHVDMGGVAAVSHGCLVALLRGEEDVSEPVLQVVQARLQANGLWLLVLSDGVSQTHALLDSKLERELQQRGQLSGSGLAGRCVQLHRWIVRGDADVGLHLRVQDLRPLASSMADGRLSASQMISPTAASAASHPAQIAAQPVSGGLAAVPPWRLKPSGAEPPEARCQTPRRDHVGASSEAADADADHVAGRRRRSTTPQRLYFSQRLSSVTPISALAHPGRGAWLLRVRVLSRTAIRQFTNVRGPGKVFTVELMDAEKSVIRASFFASAAQKFHPLLEPAGVFEVSGGTVKVQSSRFCEQPVELTFDEKHASVVAVEDDGSIPGTQYNFIALSSVYDVRLGSVVDVAGVVVALEAPVPITTRRGDATTKRVVTLADPSNVPVPLTLWGQETTAIEVEVGHILFARQVRIGEFRGRQLSSLDSSSIVVNPADERAFQLQRWYAEAGASESTVALRKQQVPSGQQAAGRRMLLAHCAAVQDVVELAASGIGAGRPAAELLRVSPLTILDAATERPPYYLSCTAPTTGRNGQLQRTCMKKVDMVGQAWMCADGHLCQQPKARYMLRLLVADCSGKAWLTAFDETAAQLLGISCFLLRLMPHSVMNVSLESQPSDCCFCFQ
eukprot:TRINITY_DN14014_c0_g1_i18.p1 TRINITY_DN14014_c0_g1~~TRINITY_DN14014_c0_g1_i18.p1  ORF type:complete len:629 (-),score=131.25 TRINITY_DN14014_c0_g1_i18:162-2048(-)